MSGWVAMCAVVGASYVIGAPATGRAASPVATGVVSRRDSAADAAILKEMTALIPKLLDECVEKRWDITRPSEKLKWTWYGGWWSQESLDFFRGWWSTVPKEYRQWAVCEDGHLRDRLFRALRPMVDSGRSLPAIEQLLLALADTTHVNTASYAASRREAPGDSSAARIVAAATALGDPHRYDHAFANYYGMRDEYLPQRGALMALLGRVYLREGRLADAARAARESRDLSRWADPMLPVEIALRQGDTAEAVRALAFCRVAAFRCTVSQARDSDTYHQLVALYRTINHGSIEGVDTVLRAVLRDSIFTMPAAAGRPSPAALASPRVTLVQYYTWAH